VSRAVTPDPINRRLLNQLQSEFPIVPQPFAILSERLGISEEEVLERAQALRQRGVLRPMGAIFDAYRVGYRSSLLSAKRRCASTPPMSGSTTTSSCTATPSTRRNA